MAPDDSAAGGRELLGAENKRYKTKDYWGAPGGGWGAAPGGWGAAPGGGAWGGANSWGGAQSWGAPNQWRPAAPWGARPAVAPVVLPAALGGAPGGACPRNAGFGGVNALAFPKLGLLCGTTTLYNTGGSRSRTVRLRAWPWQLPTAPVHRNSLDSAARRGKPRRRPPIAPPAAPTHSPARRAPSRNAGARPLQALNAGFALGPAGKGAKPLHGALRCPQAAIPAFGKIKCGFVAPYQAGLDRVMPYFTPAGAAAPCLGGGQWGTAPSVSRTVAAAAATSNYAEAVANAMSQAFGGPAYSGEFGACLAPPPRARCLEGCVCSPGLPLLAARDRTSAHALSPRLPTPRRAPAVGKAKAQSIGNSAFAAADAVAQAMFGSATATSEAAANTCFGPAQAISEWHA